MLVTAGQWISPSSAADWGEVINTTSNRTRLNKYVHIRGPLIDGLQVWYIEYPGQEYELFAYDENNPRNRIIYYCKILTSSTRNSLFKPTVGFSTAGVWKDELGPRLFALKVYQKFICKKLIDKCIITDMQQTPDGWKTFVVLADLFYREEGWKIYACFSSPSDARSVVAVTPQQLQKLRDTIMGHTRAYTFRCCVLLKNTVRVKDILNRPKSTLICDYKTALDLDLFVTPLDLTYDEELLFLSESRENRYKHK